ncbi:MAG: tripartite tricarboxylate transporter permease [Candidatus Micrarchaeota archaeon]
MILEFAAGFLAGFLGLVAFLHVNFILQALSTLIPAGFSKAVFSSSLSFSKIVFELIPTLFFVIPSTSFGAAVLPGQKLFLEGKGIVALKTILASFFYSMLLCVLFLPIVFVLLPVFFAVVSPVAGFALAAVTAIALFSKRTLPQTVFSFVLSGVLGVVVLSKPLVHEPLFPLLSGLFGIPALLFSLDAQKPSVQEDSSKTQVDLKMILAGVLLGGFSSVLPALSPVFIVSFLFFALEPLGENAFLQAGASTLVSKTFFDFAAFTAIGKARAGAVAFAAGELSSVEGLLPVLAAGAASLFLAIAVLLFSYRFFSKLSSFHSKNLMLAVVSFIVLASFFSNGPLGVFILGVSASVGIVIGGLGVRKTSALGALIVPSLFYYFGLSLY